MDTYLRDISSYFIPIAHSGTVDVTAVSSGWKYITPDTSGMESVQSIR